MSEPTPIRVPIEELIAAYEGQITTLTREVVQQRAMIATLMRERPAQPETEQPISKDLQQRVRDRLKKAGESKGSVVTMPNSHEPEKTAEPPQSD